MKLPIAITTFACLALFATTAPCQTVGTAGSQTAAQSQKADVRTELRFRASNSSGAMSLRQFRNLSQPSTTASGSANTADIENLIPVAASVMSAEVSRDLASIANGAIKSFHTGVIAGQNVLDRRSITMKIYYEPRPIGGILNVRVDLVPVFTGVGGASRPTASRSIAEAVDNLDENIVKEVVTRLSEQLANEAVVTTNE